MTSDTTSFDDQPIDAPKQDSYGIDPFARTLAKSIARMPSPNGVVLAIHGVWGSGKSSAINLIRHHLEHTEKAEISIADFKCWWFRGEEALTVAFFRELYAVLGETFGKKASKILGKIYDHLPAFGNVAGKAVDLAGGGGIGAVIGKISSLFPTRKTETVESLHREISNSLTAAKKRLLVIIDDIDRLSPDEALQMFRLVKSVGRLPNVIYLLAFDRALAEKIVAEKYPSEGPHYLEKIVQAGFDIPTPKESALREALRGRLMEICDVAADDEAEEQARFENVLYDVIFPEISTPRDMVRLENTLVVTWPAIKDEVDRVDFIALETLRLKQPAIYRAILENKNLVCVWSEFYKNKHSGAEVETACLGQVPDRKRQHYRRALARVFPPLKAIWDNAEYGTWQIKAWRRQRRACSSEHFESYFRLAIGDDVLSRAEIKGIIGKIQSDDQNGLRDILRAAAQQKRYDQSTKARQILEELRARGEDIAGILCSAKTHFIQTLFELSGELDIEEDRLAKDQYSSNFERIHFLAFSLCDNINIKERTKIFLTALQNAPLSWRIYFFHQLNNTEMIIINQNDLEKIKTEALTILRSEIERNTLGEQKRLLEALYFWRDTAKDGGAEVRQWTSQQLENPEMVKRFARAFTHDSYITTRGDEVVQRDLRLEVLERLKTIIDLAAFRQRLAECKDDPIIDRCLSLLPDKP